MEHEIWFTTFQPGIATSQPHEFLRNGATILGRKAANRVTKSREVNFSPLRDFHLHFPPHMGSGITGLLGFFKSHLQILYLISGIYWLICWFHSDKNNWTGVCFSDIERANFSTSCLSCHLSVALRASNFTMHKLRTNALNYLSHNFIPKGPKELLWLV